MSFTRKMFTILTKRILTCLSKKRGLFSILVQNNPRVTKKGLVFRKVARSCSPTEKLLKILKVAKKSPSRIWKVLVWSIIPLFMQKISTRVVCVNGEHPRFYPVLQLWGFCEFEVLYPFFMQISTRMVCVNGKHPLFYPILQLWGFCRFEVLYPFLRTRFPPGWFVLMISTPCSTPYFSYEAFGSLKHYTPFYAEDFHPDGLCKW